MKIRSLPHHHKNLFFRHFIPKSRLACASEETTLIFLQWNHVFVRHLLVKYWLIPSVDMLTECWLLYWLIRNRHTDLVAADMLTEISGHSTNTHVRRSLVDMLLILNPYTQPTLLSLDLVFLVSSILSTPMLTYFLRPTSFFASYIWHRGMG